MIERPRVQAIWRVLCATIAVVGVWLLIGSVGPAPQSLGEVALGDAIGSGPQAAASLADRLPSVVRSRGASDVRARRDGGRCQVGSSEGPSRHRDACDPAPWTAPTLGSVAPLTGVPVGAVGCSPAGVPPARSLQSCEPSGARGPRAPPRHEVG